MENETLKQLRLGLFVIAGTLLLIAALYFIGRNQNLFGPTIRVVAYFGNINGLQPGNIVRFSGVDAGTVESVDVMSDTAIRVVISLQDKYREFIKADALASIGTDGLMGNKLVNIINNPHSIAETIQDGSTIFTLKPVETDEMLRTLNQTNEYVEEIAYNLKNITDKIGNSRGTIWKLLSDTSLSGRVDSTVIYLQLAGKNVSEMSSRLNRVVKHVNDGKGLLGTLVKDTLIAQQLHTIVASLNEAGEQSSQASAELLGLIRDVENGEGTLGVLLKDSVMSDDIKTAVSNLKQSSEGLNRSIDAISRMPVFKKYMEEPEKKKK